jgi:ATP-dependent exoDNAse (exonuclease V) alpha subunit
MGLPFYSWKRDRWVIGGVTYFPMRLGYASTVHKTQGLTLDRVQIDIRGGFFSQPNMAYVALSRVRTPEGMRIVGSPDLLAKKIRSDPAVVGWT